MGSVTTTSRCNKQIRLRFPCSRKLQFSNSTQGYNKGLIGLAGREGGCVTANHTTTSHANSTQVTCPPAHVEYAGDFDKGLFSVSLKTVQFTDTFDSSMYMHVNGPSKADLSGICLVLDLARQVHDNLLFELPPGCKLHSGSAPEAVFQNLIPLSSYPASMG